MLLNQHIKLIFIYYGYLIYVANIELCTIFVLIYHFFYILVAKIIKVM